MMCNGVAGWVGMVVGSVESLAGYAGGAADFVGGAADSVGFVGRTVGCVGTTAGSVGEFVELVVALSAAVKPTDHWVSEEWTWQEVHLLVVVGA